MGVRFGSSSREEKAKSFAVPGPGTYVAPPRVGKEGNRYSMSGRNFTEHKSGTRSPGPGAYSLATVAVEGKGKIYRH